MDMGYEDSDEAVLLFGSATRSPVLQPGLLV